MSIFTKVPVNRIPSNTFDLTHSVKMSCNADYLIPILCEEVIPGDRFSYNPLVMARLAPMVAPVMHEMNITTFSFFVPLRLLWPNFDKFMESDIPDQNTPVAPYFEDVTISVGSLGDYLGLPTHKYGNDVEQYTELDKISALPFAAYQKIWYDWFRDQNLYTQETEPILTDGLNNFDDFNILQKRAWQHDYFTSALPWAQKGEGVAIPLVGFEDVPVNFNHPATHEGNAVTWEATDDIDDPYQPFAKQKFSDSEDLSLQELYAQTSALEVEALSINSLRWAVKLQEYLEKNARGGSRYIEKIRMHFGVKSSDARLQRSEFIGASSQPIVISEVLQTSESGEDTTPLGEMAGHGISVGRGKYTKYFAEEHGFFITVLNIRPKSAYSQGIHKKFSRWSPLDYAWPSFAQLGEQEILRREIFYSTSNPEMNDNVFGYTPRYSEYKYANDRIAGEFRTSLMHWHLGRTFSTPPALNSQFIESNMSKRIFAVENAGTHPFYLNIKNNLSVRRKLPKYGIPSL